MTEVVPFRRKSYEAKQVEVYASGMTVIAAGTLDGFLDFVVQAKGGDRIGYQITRDDARAIIAALHAVVDDVTANCLFDRDPLLMPEDSDNAVLCSRYTKNVGVIQNSGYLNATD